MFSLWGELQIANFLTWHQYKKYNDDLSHLNSFLSLVYSVHPILNGLFLIPQYYLI